MILARVTGTVAATRKCNDLEGLKLLVVRKMTPSGVLKGNEMIAVDTVQSGIGDDVLLLDEGGSAGIMLGMKSQAIRAVIAGIVDKIDFS